MLLDRDSLRKIAVGFAAVTEMVGTSLAGFAIGYGLDHWIKKTNPWLTVVFAVAGVIGGFVRLYRIYTRENNES